MPERAQGWNDRRVEGVIGYLLRFGVILAALVVLAGLVLYLIPSGSATPHYRVFRGEPAALRGFESIILGVSALDGPSLIQFGLLLLIFTPVARVVFSVVAFALERDATYVAVSLIVLSVLLYSISGG